LQALECLLGRLRARFHQDERKLVAADAISPILLTQRPKLLADARQDGVTVGVSALVVYRFEIVDVDQGQD